MMAPPVALVTGTPLTITLVNNSPLGSVEVVNEELKLAAAAGVQHCARGGAVFLAWKATDRPANASAAEVASQVMADTGPGPLGGFLRAVRGAEPARPGGAVVRGRAPARPPRGALCAAQHHLRH